MQQTTVLRVTPGQDPTILQAYLTAHFAHERATGVRELLVHALAAGGAVVWLDAAQASLLGAGAHRALLVGWALGALMTLVSLLAEERWRRRAASLQLRVDSPPR